METVKYYSILFQVGFSPWIEGLPTVLVDVKPWALFVNATGHPVSFVERLDSEEVAFVVPPSSVFTPPKIKVIKAIDVLNSRTVRALNQLIIGMAGYIPVWIRIR